MIHTIHSEEYCIRRIKELKEKNLHKEWSLGDTLLLDNFEKILNQYKNKK